MAEVDKVWIDHKLHGYCRDGGGGTVMILIMVVVHHEYNDSIGEGNTYMVSEAHVWWNRQWFNGDDIHSGGAGMDVCVIGVCFE